jgi:hypothetical protein
MEKKKTVKIFVPHSIGICPKCAKTAEQDGNLLVAYCPHNECGGYMNVNSGLWTLHVPITHELFRKAIDAYRASSAKSESWKTFC